jgi:peroxiredoxin
LKWLEQAGLTVDLSSHGLGKRGTRFALVLGM